jgi:transposase-like protein
MAAMEQTSIVELREQENQYDSERTRRTYTAEFKAMLVLESIEGKDSLADLARKYNVHPNQIKNWRTQMRKRLGMVFIDRRTSSAKPMRYESSPTL